MCYKHGFQMYVWSTPQNDDHLHHNHYFCDPNLQDEVCLYYVCLYYVADFATSLTCVLFLVLFQDCYWAMFSAVTIIH